MSLNIPVKTFTLQISELDMQKGDHLTLWCRNAGYLIKLIIQTKHDGSIVIFQSLDDSVKIRPMQEFFAEQY